MVCADRRTRLDQGHIVFIDVSVDSHFKEHRVVSAVLLYLVINILFTIPYVAWQRKQAAKLVSHV